MPSWCSSTCSGRISAQSISPPRWPNMPAGSGASAPGLAERAAATAGGQLAKTTRAPLDLGPRVASCMRIQGSAMRSSLLPLCAWVWQILCCHARPACRRHGLTLAARWSDLRLRVLSAAVLAPLALICIWLGGAGVRRADAGRRRSACWPNGSRHGAQLATGRRQPGCAGVLYILLAAAALVWLRADPAVGSRQPAVPAAAGLGQRYRRLCRRPADRRPAARAAHFARQDLVGRGRRAGWRPCWSASPRAAAVRRRSSPWHAGRARRRCSASLRRPAIWRKASSSAISG